MGCDFCISQIISDRYWLCDAPQKPNKKTYIRLGPVGDFLILDPLQIFEMLSYKGDWARGNRHIQTEDVSADLQRLIIHVWTAGNPSSRKYAEVTERVRAIVEGNHINTSQSHYNGRQP